MDNQHPEILEAQEQPNGFLRWWLKNGKWTTFTLVVVLVAIVAWKWQAASVRNAHDRNWQQFADSTSPERMLATADIARDAGLMGLSNLALLSSADLGAEKATFTNNAVGTGSGEPTRSRLMAEAQRTYHLVLADPDATLPFRLNAMMGLATIAENRQDWDAARQWYQKVQDEAGDLYPAHKDRAQLRVTQLKILSRRLVFAPEPPPATSPPPPAAGSATDESTGNNTSETPRDLLPTVPSESGGSTDAAPDSQQIDTAGGL